MTAPEQTTPARTGWDRLRLVLAVVWLGLLLAALALREDDRSLAELYREVEAGRVEQVELVGGLLAFEQDFPGTTRDAVNGSAQLDVRWGPLFDRHVVTVLEVAGQGSAGSSDGRETTTDDVGARLRALDPGLRVEQQAYGVGVRGALLGARLPGVLVLVLLAAGLATLLLLVNGPEPWRATRWAWFWLLPVPFAVLALCLLAGPTPGVPAPRSQRRLTGGWAFLAAASLGGGTWAS